MPCYEVRTISVEFKAENRNLLDAAARSIGLNDLRNVGNGRLEMGPHFGAYITLDLTNGRAEVRDGYQSLLNELKRAYSREAIKAAAKQVNWACKMTGNQATITKMKW
jgi:hypothetical protein